MLYWRLAGLLRLPCLSAYGPHANMRGHRLACFFVAGWGALQNSCVFRLVALFCARHDGFRTKFGLFEFCPTARVRGALRPGSLTLASIYAAWPGCLEELRRYASSGDALAAMCREAQRLLEAARAARRSLAAEAKAASKASKTAAGRAIVSSRSGAAAGASSSTPMSKPAVTTVAAAAMVAVDEAPDCEALALQGPATAVAVAVCIDGTQQAAAAAPDGGMILTNKRSSGSCSEGMLVEMVAISKSE